MVAVASLIPPHSFITAAKAVPHPCPARVTPLVTPGSDKTGPLSKPTLRYVGQMNRDRVLLIALLVLALAGAAAVVAVAFTANSILITVAFALWAAVAATWFVLRARTGYLVRNELESGAIDPRLGGIGIKHYSVILGLAAVVAFLAWLAVNSSPVVAALCVAGISFGALAIGRVRSSGYRQRQESIVEVTR